MAIDFQPDDSNKIDFQLDFQEDAPSGKEDKLGLKKQVSEQADWLKGAGEAGLEMISGLPSQIAGGLWGLSTLASGQGLDKAAENVRKAQETNLGFGKYTPKSEKGVQSSEELAKQMEKPIRGAGNIGFKFGGELGRTNAEIAAESLMNLIDPALAIKAVRTVKPGQVAGPSKVPETAKVSEVVKDFQADDINTRLGERLNDATLRKQAEERVAKYEAENAAKEATEVGSDVNALEEVLRGDRERAQAMREDAVTQTMLEEQLQKQLADEAAAKQAERPNLTSLEDIDGQMSMFDQADIMGQRNQFNAGDLGDWRWDEHGIPVRADKTLDALSLDQPLQRDLFGSDPYNVDQIPAGVQNRANGRFTPGTVRGDALGMLTGETPAGPDLQRAIMEAEGNKLPFEETTQFQPSNPLPTQPLGDTLPPPSTPTLGSGPGTPPSGPAGPYTPPWAKVKEANPSQSFNSPGLEALPKEMIPPPVDSVQTPRSPETITQRAEQRAVLQTMPESMQKIDAISEFNKVATVEEARSLAEKDGWKDLSRDFGRRQFSSGAGQVAAMSNNPFVKYARDAFRDARNAAEGFSRQYISAKDGISPTWKKLNADQRIDVMNALREGDANQVRVNDAMMDSMNFSPEQKQFVNKFYEANKAAYDWYNENLTKAGMKPLPFREGHFPGVFKGSYKSLVMDGDKVVAVIGADSVYQRNAAKKYFAEKNPEFQVIDQKRKGLSDYKNQSDIFSGMNDLLQVLAENDPRFADIQARVDDAIKHGNNSLLNFNVHEKGKKGVLGNEGNRPWQDAKANTEDMYKAMVQYFEEGAMHHALQDPLRDIKNLATDPDMQKRMPNTLEYLNSYTKHITGQNANNPVASILNAAIDAPFKYTGFGPGPGIALAGSLKNRMSQVFMGWGNWTFTAAQLIQPMQTGLPVLQSVAGRIGDTTYTPVAMAKGGTQFMMASLEDMTGKKMSALPAHAREAYQYAKERGLLQFSELERAYEGSKSAVGRGVDKVAEFNMKAGEVATRTPMFMSFVELLNHAGIENKYALPLAENMTQYSMIDYHQFERPQLYGKMGVMGQFAGGLTTFKHGFVGQQLKHMKGLSKGEVLPIAQSAAAMVTLAGVAGMPFYDELDSLYGAITDTFFDKRMNLRDTALANAPEMVKSGVVANLTNVGIQSKFSSANMLPDPERIGAALSPQLAHIGVLLGDAVDLAKNKDDQAFRNLMIDLTPSGQKGMTEAAVSTSPSRAEPGKIDVVGRDGQVVVRRTPEEQAIRKWTGLRSNREVQEREQNFRSRNEQRADQEAQKKIGIKFNRRLVNGDLNPEAAKEMALDLNARKGDPASLFQKAKIEKMAADAQKTERERMQGTPKNLTSTQKFMYYNKPGER